jgi:hypothetical protein
MRRFGSGIAGLVLTFALAGCGETAPEGPIESKQINNEAIAKLRDNMAANAKSGKYKEKPTEKPADTKTTDKK